MSNKPKVLSTKYTMANPTDDPSCLSKAEQIELEKWTPSTSNTVDTSQQIQVLDSVIVPNGNAPDSSTCEVVERTTMLGFSSFLIAAKSVTFVVYLVLLIVSVILLHPSFFYTILAFGVAELVLILITIYHGIRPTLKAVLAMLSFEMALSIVKLVFAIVMMAKDGGQDCSIDHPCLLNISSPERFGLFFFILITAFLDGLTALLTIANSPQMHEFELGDEYLF